MSLLPLHDPDALPNLAGNHVRAFPEPADEATGPPRILLLYGSLRGRSYSRFLTLEAARLLRHFGAEPPIFDPSGRPLPDDASADHHRSGNCVICPPGRRDMSGAARSVTAT